MFNIFLENNYVSPTHLKETFFSTGFVCYNSYSIIQNHFSLATPHSLVTTYC